MFVFEDVRPTMSTELNTLRVDSGPEALEVMLMVPSVRAESSWLNGWGATRPWAWATEASARVMDRARGLREKERETDIT